MWMVLSLLLLLFIGMLSFSLAERFYFFKSGKFSIQKLDIFSVIVLSFSIIFGGTFLYGSYPQLPIYTWIVMLLLLWGLYYFPLPNWTKVQKGIFQSALCATGVFGVLMTLPEMSLGYWVVGGILTLSWLLGWHLFSYFDKYALTSHIVSGGWTLAFLLTTFMIPTFPKEVCLFAGIIGIPVFVICKKRLSYGVFNLGLPTAKIAGFAWAGIWTICLLQANLAILLLVYGYYFMELFLLLKHKKGKVINTLLERGLSDVTKRGKTLFIVLSHVFLMAFLALFLTMMVPKPHVAFLTCLIFMLVVCYDLYIKLNNLDRNVGSWKDIFSELKQGMNALPKASKDMLKEIKSGLKTQKRRTKKTVRKKKK